MERVSGLFRIKKILNNNVVIAVHPVFGETVLIGKGLGFHKRAGAVIDEKTVEKCFVLYDPKEQEQYKQLLNQVDDRLVEVMNEVVQHIQDRFQSPLNEHIHVALMDHIAFAIKRTEQGLSFHNPFLIETRTLYQKEYQVAEEIVRWINRAAGCASAGRRNRFHCPSHSQRFDEAAFGGTSEIFQINLKIDSIC